jgi:hypothetical protein
MKILISLMIFVALVAVWVAWLRPVLRTKPWAQGFFAAIEPIEITLWRKSETILWARLKMVVGVVLTILTQTQAIDLSPIMPFVPDQYEPLVKMAFNLMPLIITVVGWVDEQLRKDTTKPLVIVETPQDAPPAVAAAVAKVDAANASAVAVVDAAKA